MPKRKTPVADLFEWIDEIKALRKSKQEGLIGFADENYASAVASLCHTLETGAFTTAQVYRLRAFAENIGQLPGGDFYPPIFEVALMASLARAGFTLGDINRLTGKLTSAKPGQRIILTVRGGHTVHTDVQLTGPRLVARNRKDT